MDRFRVASLLAVLAVLAVLGTTVTAVAAYTQRDRDPATPTADQPSAAASSSGVSKEHVFDDGQFVVGDRDDNALFEVPAGSEGWTTESSDTVIYYVDRNGDPAVGVNGPAVFKDGYCKGSSGISNRGFVGFTRTATEMSAREANTDLSRDWVAAVSLNEDLRTSSPHTPLRTTEVTLGDGSTAVRTSSRITLDSDDPCDPPAVELTMVSLDTGDAVANLVLVRDLGVRGALTDELADQIVDTLHRAVGP
jgi:hypothetical protein